ncbi:MAG: hypothetical protein ACOY4Q_07775 [Bacillota bacterium]
METYVTGKITADRAEEGRIRGLMDRLSPVGYMFTETAEGVAFTKPGRIESVITEMVPVCEDHGLDVEDFDLREYRKSDNRERSRYDNGKIIRD